jgi:tRNA pseudouridine38-40 synthase
MDTDDQQAGRGEASGGRFRITVAYDGTAYGGWQIQPNANTVQAELQAVLKRLGGGDVLVHGSGRTDAGVHARGQVAHFDFPRPFAPVALVRAMNACLPPDIRVVEAAIVAGDFHARKSAIGKEYRYFIWNAPVMLPTARLYHLHEHEPLDTERMQAAAGALIGQHDFAAFSANPNRFVETTVRTIQSLAVSRVDEQITIAVHGDGFLYRMVRSLAGWLIRVGRGEVPPEQTAAILASRERTAHVPTAPPQGLFLWQVDYPLAEISRSRMMTSCLPCRRRMP